MSKQTLQLHSTVFTIHSLDVDSPIPSDLFKEKIFFISKTHDELSIVCPSSFIINSLDAEHNWLALEVVGPLGFSLTGIMANISGVLANASISIFALSTYDTDYILVKKQRISDAIKTLKKDGYTVLEEPT
ncbi:MAG: ACT domain-containing protein [Pseudoalteromonas sp.]|uniref:ACT domain-containing protein n=1 Tax=unclassified Pseudoalteromonas TaxID=194690 RepID=UPI000C079A82|nr:MULTISPECIES: ACT domain-containing protein [unclassified Pseudoalteromonas]MDP2633718.1 ACT domain-containing protein [Pseudoalteromonas sp. 1_MG-2023]PHN89699.1 amino acid-binding protein [Pseudoalteromonas sp. 3D05]PHN89840.1 amino acid-binding protein [Pseudoalteromonas sp. 3D05]TGE81300.1 ACT domain-containing protein [Pseudoalteromonas sp. KS88]